MKKSHLTVAFLHDAVNPISRSSSPPSLTHWGAASPPESQGFVIAGLVFLLPLILGYTGWSYRVFRGKVATDAGYH